MDTTATYERLSVTPCTTAVGAEIGGIDLSAGVDDEQLAELRRAFADHGVIFLRDQDITPEQHEAFAERWGVHQREPLLHPGARPPPHRRGPQGAGPGGQHRRGLAHRPLLRPDTGHGVAALRP